MAGDAVAASILEQAGEHLGRLAAHVLRALCLEGAAAPVVPVGGVLEQPGPVRDAVAAWLRDAVPDARLRPPCRP